MNKIDHALRLAAHGFHVFPLVPNSKIPRAYMDDFPNKATTDSGTIRGWWGDDPHANIGISTTRFNGSGHLLGVDIDKKNGQDGDDTLFGFELEGQMLPNTFTQHTPTGGKHLLYYCTKPVGNNAKKIGKGLDIRGQGGYVVGAGSTLNGKLYTAEIGPVAPAPEWLIEKCGESKAKGDRSPAVEGVDQDAAYVRGEQYITDSAPEVLEGERNHAAFKVAAHLKDLGISEYGINDLMTGPWSTKCNPPLSTDEINAVVSSAFKNSRNAPGSLSPEAVFTPVVTTETEDKFYLHQINEQYALLFEDGGHVIMEETYNLKQKKHFLKMHPEASFNRKFSNKVVQITDGKTTKDSTYAKEWFKWPERREYEGLEFSPERAPSEGYYNLWRGFRVEPLAYEDADLFQRAGFDAFMEHAKENVTGNDPELFNWLMGYFAHMIQKPYEKPLTTLVFQGRKGTGKNALVERVGFLLGDHFAVTSNARYLTSNFNGHMDAGLMLVLDEAFWSGDKSAEGTLKGLTTSSQIMIERKGKEPYMVANLIRLVVIGNEEWLVPASADERRYAVFTMGEGRMQQVKFFEDMRVNLEDLGGARVLLDYLKKFDLTTTNPNVAPKTEGLRLQKKESWNPTERFWYDCLASGTTYSGRWEEQVDKVHLIDAAHAFHKRLGASTYRVDTYSLGTFFRKASPSTRTDSKRRDADRFVRTFTFPDLETARAEWSAYAGFSVDWSEQ